MSYIFFVHGIADVSLFEAVHEKFGYEFVIEHAPNMNFGASLQAFLMTINEPIDVAKRIWDALCLDFKKEGCIIEVDKQLRLSTACWKQIEMDIRISAEISMPNWNCFVEEFNKRSKQLIFVKQQANEMFICLKLEQH